MGGRFQATVGVVSERGYDRCHPTEGMFCAAGLRKDTLLLRLQVNLKTVGSGPAAAGDEVGTMHCHATTTERRGASCYQEDGCQTMADPGERPVVLLGNPNVGKSALFSAFTGLWLLRQKTTGG